MHRRRPARAAAVSLVDQPASRAQLVFAAVVIGAMILTSCVVAIG